jgi:Protein O-mannosyl-transferase TMEM260-like
MLAQRFSRHADRLIGAVLFLLTFAIYLRTLAPSVAEMFDDSLEFQLVAARLAIAHPTGYPLFTILLHLFTYLPVGDVAYRVNLATALFGALAVVGIYAVARQLVRSRSAAVVAALTFAFGETFWSQAVLAEVYTFQALLTTVMLWLVLLKSQVPSPKFKIRIWNFEFQVGHLEFLAFFFGLMLTHHRMSLLLFPALAVYVLSYDRQFLREPRTLLRLAIAFALPLLLYLYIPLRGLVTSSLDGTYQNTPAGFLSWVLGSSYSVFLTQNPLNEHYDAAFYLNLFVQQFTWLGLVLAALGLIALTRRAWREGLLLALGLVVNLAFALTYRVADIAVFFIPSFLFVALLLAPGADALAQWLSHTLSHSRLLAFTRSYAQTPVLLLLALPLLLLSSNFAAVDLSDKWDVHDYGRDVLAQPLPPDSTVIGILGEMSLLRYFQETQGLRRDVATVAADQEPARLAAIDAALKQDHAVFLTRPLPGLENKYSLVSFGPLIQVQPKPNATHAPAPAHPLGDEFGGVKLVGYALDRSRLNDGPNWHLDNGRRLRVTLYWQVEHKIADSLSVSIKLLAADGTRGAQLDRRPVLDAYPTTAWRAGEFISDTYDLPILIGAKPGEYALQVTLYDPNSGAVQGQRNLEKITLAPDTHHYSRVALLEEITVPPLLRQGVDPSANGDHIHRKDYGAVSLAADSLDTSAPYGAGDPVPVTLLWQVQEGGAHPRFGLALRDGSYHVVQRQTAEIPSSSAVPGMYLRQDFNLALPASLPPGTLTLELYPAPRDDLACDLPLFSSCIVLGRISVGR